jgi:hypothetical protein
MPDRDGLAWAPREHRILLTFNKDFGELARASALPRTCGVVLLRMPMPTPEEAGLRLAALITAREDWAGNFSVIEPGRATAGTTKIRAASSAHANWGRRQVEEGHLLATHGPHHHSPRLMSAIPASLVTQAVSPEALPSTVNNDRPCGALGSRARR